MAGEKFVRLIKQGARHAIPENTLTDLVPGEVTNESPLTVLVENRFKIDQDFLVLSPFCREFKDKNGSVLFENLKIGEKVLLLRVSNGQQFYVLDRGELKK
ncbi:DUF2577 domain-containing protein [Paraclostridium sordellii]|uniref:DUF2577 domain-containing protein n=1 Tax=Paraclostridium sordellii TaxID=1505 RepID=UPI0005E2B536|nr:DUF2577 domain-containing protein [Paeniclostridium sordellii]MDU6247299.1 DUF2577 domain-containing protein [Paeniclostridium sordellii]MRZ79663.1 DUF2577 domain-containing protein [Paeniclostridium sordellii]MSB57729.1 DUF2577 domain-containing protein [Paeniclostridium sordellii]MVO70963.1 DUF2577 domain-containing protein [Paeniclostridium sordellii]CEO27177.1 phage protein [[Clostridium] sordellii] [Paeniclostridium sordellii]